MLLSSFMSRKQALGQAGQQTPEEQRAISELLRRATEDNGGSSVLGVSIGSGPSRSPLISRTGRGLFDIPVRDKGLVRSSSHSVLAGSPARHRASQKISLGSPATSWRPLHASVLGQSQTTTLSDSHGSQSQQQPARKPAASGNNGQLPYASSVPRQASTISKSTSMFTFRHDRNRNEASPDLGKSTDKVTPTPGTLMRSKDIPYLYRLTLHLAHTTGNAQPQPRSIKSAAARTLEGLLNQVESETDKKVYILQLLEWLILTISLRSCTSNPSATRTKDIGSTSVLSRQRPQNLRLVQDP